MKKILVLFLIGYCSLQTTFAQVPYVLTRMSNAYSPLSNPVSLNGTTVWTSFQSFTVPIGFTFNFMGNNYSNLYIEGSGFTYFDPGYDYMIHPFLVQMQDRGTGTSASPLSYELTGTAPTRILKVEWSNCGFNSDLNAFANFQLWLNEGGNVIEVHIGPLNIPNPATAFAGNGTDGPVVGIFNASGIPDYGYYFSGIVPSEAGIFNSNVTNIFACSITGLPALNEVYVFMPGSNGISENELSGISLFPNPSTGPLNFAGLTPNPYSCTIFSYTGEQLLEYNDVADGDRRFPELPFGFYFVRISSEKASRVFSWVLAN